MIARGAVDTGDQVFVDKFSYNFVKPHRGDVFVFRTDHILGITADPETGAPFFIKRLAGLPGDTLRIDPPRLYVNGELAEGFGFGRVMAAKEPYRGYAPGHDYLSDPNEDVTWCRQHQLLCDGRQQLQQLRQPLVGAGAGGEPGRARAVCLLAIQSGTGA